MTDLRHDFERWAVGTPVATGGTSSGANDANLTVASVTGTGTKNAGTMPDAAGKGVYLYAADSASVAAVGWTFASASDAEAVSFDLILDALPGVAQRVLNTYDGGNGSSSPHLDINAAGQFMMMNSAHVAVVTGSTVAPLNTRLHCQAYVAKGTTTSDGTGHMKVTRRDNGTVIFDSTRRTNIDADTIGFRGFQVGRPSTANWTGGFWIDNLAYSDTATGLIEAVVPTVTPAANEWDARVADLRGTSVASGTISSHVLSWVSGPNNLAGVVEPIDGLFLIPRGATTSVYRDTITGSAGGVATYDITVAPIASTAAGIVREIRLAGAWV